MSLTLRSKNQQRKTDVAIQTSIDKMSMKLEELENAKIAFEEEAASYSIRYNREKDKSMASVLLKMKKVHENHACLITMWQRLYQQVISDLESGLEASLDIAALESEIEVLQTIKATKQKRMNESHKKLLKA